MKVRIGQFIDFAYGDKRRDKAKVLSILEEMKSDYDPAKDRYKKFREAMNSFEEGYLSKRDFLQLHKQVSANKAAGYKVLSENYLDAKEDHALIWQGRNAVVANIPDLEISTAWYLRTEANNQRRIVYLHFGKDPLPRQKERGYLSILRMAEPEAAGVGILNIQPGTLIFATRINQAEITYLQQRAEKFVTLAQNTDT